MSLKSVVTSYFDLIVDPMFQRDAQGREVFFPRGLGSRGYFVPDEATSNSMRRTLRGWFMVLIPVIGLTAPLFQASLLWFLAAIAVFVGLQMSFTSWLARELPKADMRMTLANQTASIAKNYSWRTILLIAAMGIAMSVACGWAFFHDPEMPQRSIIGLSALLFGFSTAMWVAIAIRKMPARHV